ncbi:hypothetical protein [Clostridium tyrobutyricum]|uniref:hypothetical protein n=1 Tax=Clostridium tyrobutyricum TaxID=1519 RepID=UPI00057D67C9|nr:hypothetical protein [Clostridium tyrobutyricum]
MPNSKRCIKIVQFFHNGGEHITNYRSSGNRKHRWDKEKIIKDEFMPSNLGEHRRKFMVNKGKCLNQDLSKSIKTDIAFWGEWENPSKFKPIKYNNIDERLHKWLSNSTNKKKVKITNTKKDCYFQKNDIPQYVHYKFYKENNKKIRENTDPYIFGNTFYYCCCKQTDKYGNPRWLQTNLASGSLILFGSRLNDRFILDTVFVVNDFKPYCTSSKDNLYFKKVLSVTDTYSNASLEPLRKNKNKLMLYSGAMFDSKYSIGENKIFSFFPCKKVNKTEDISQCASNAAFSRPFLDLKKYNLTIAGRGASGNILEKYKKDNLITKSDEEVVAIYWKMIVDDIIQQEFNIGTFTEEPKS